MLAEIKESGVNENMEVLNIKQEQEVLSLLTGISFANVPYWYGGTRRDLKMDLIIPKHIEGHELCPAVVWVCGGAFMVADRSIWMPEMVRFARSGYVVASVEYRTSNDAPFPAPLMDIKSAIRYLKAHSRELCIDPEKIFIMGESAGGTLASLAGTTSDQKEYEQGDFLEFDSSVCGVVDFYGITDITGKNECAGSEDVPDYAAEAFLGWGKSKETAVRASAVYQITDKTPPFMILHGTDDALVPMEQSSVFYEKLKKKGRDVAYYVLEGAGHGDDRFYQDEVIKIILKFLDRVSGK